MNSRHVATVVAFVAAIFGLTALDLLHPPAEISVAERRMLAQRPEFSLGHVMDGSFAVESSLFLRDQFVFRDGFRRLKSTVERSVLRKRENNGVYVVGDTLYDKFYGINQHYIDRAAGLIDRLIDEIGSSRVYLSVIPSKAHVLEGDEYLLSDQTPIADTLRRNTGAEYIDLMSLPDRAAGALYYRTDHHWTTQGAIQAYAALAEAMGYEPIVDYTYEEVSATFVGSLYGKAAASSIPRDRIHLAHNELLDDMTVCRYATLESVDCFDSVYFGQKIDGLDPYDVFLGGAAPIIVIENRRAPSEQRLALFKDSYSHVLAPFLAQHFGQVMLFDLRYVRKELILREFDLSEDTVLFLYSTIILNTDPQIVN